MVIESHSKTILTDDEQEWIMNICKDKISNRIENQKQKWSESFRVDSLAYIEMIVEIENKLGFEFPNEVLSFRMMDSVSEVISLVCIYKK